MSLPRPTIGKLCEYFKHRSKYFNLKNAILLEEKFALIGVQLRDLDLGVVRTVRELISDI